MVYLALLVMILAKGFVLQAVLVKSEQMSKPEASKAAYLCFIPALSSLVLSLPIALFAMPWAAIGMGMSGHSSNLTTPELFCSLVLNLPAYYVPVINLLAVPLVYALVYGHSSVTASIGRLVAGYLSLTVVEYVLLITFMQIIRF